MKLFQLSASSHDGDYKFYTVENIVAFMDKIKQGEIPGTPVKLTIYEGKSKKEKAKRLDFNVSTSLPYFFVNEEIKDEMKHMNVEFIPVETNDHRLFYLTLPKNSINIINFKDSDDLFDMILEGRFKFIEEINLKGIYLFTDPNLPSDIFFTEEYVNRFKDKIKGASFEQIT